MAYESISLTLYALASDLASVGLALDAGLCDPARDEWVAGIAGTVPEGFDAEDLVLVHPGRALSISRVDNAGEMAVEIVDAICDWVMDELGRGWPELADEAGNFIAPLRPVPSAGGVRGRGEDSESLSGTSEVTLCGDASDPAALFGDQDRLLTGATPSWPITVEM